MSKTLKTLLTLLLTCASFMIVYGQDFRGIDKSPMDRAFLPDNFAHDREGGDEAIIRVTYSRPQKKDRVVFGGLVAYDKVWRTGANEATEIKFYQDVTFGGKKVKAGAYALFSIPGKDEWTIILNSDLDYWGHYSYNEKADVLRVKASYKTIEDTVEAFTIQFTKKGETPTMMWLAWDTTVVEVPIEY